MVKGSETSNDYGYYSKRCTSVFDGSTMCTFDMLEVADFIAKKVSGLFSLEMWGGATYDTCMRFLENVLTKGCVLREKIPNVLFQMLLRGSNAVGYANYPDNVVREFVIHSSEAEWMFLGF